MGGVYSFGCGRQRGCGGYVWVWKIYVHAHGSKLCDFMLGMCVLSCELRSATPPQNADKRMGGATWNAAYFCDTIIGCIIPAVELLLCLSHNDTYHPVHIMIRTIHFT